MSRITDFGLCARTLSWVAWYEVSYNVIYLAQNKKKKKKFRGNVLVLKLAFDECIGWHA